jgi:hypothetical protein
VDSQEVLSTISYTPVTLTQVTVKAIEHRAK